MTLLRTRYRFIFLLISVVVVELAFWAVVFALWLVVTNFLPTLRFHFPQYWWLLLSIPAMSIIYLISIRNKNKAIARLADSSLVAYVLPQISSLRSLLKFLFFRFGLTFAIVGLIDPKLGTKLTEVKSKGVDIMIALDVSNSMLAEDVSPNRLQRAKYSIEQLVGKLHGDRIGLVIFAGSAYVQMPITNDYAAARLFLNTINTNSISEQGTSIGNAIRLCVESFDEKSVAQKVIMVITDGEDHENEAIDAAKAASENHKIIVHTIGIGTPEGTVIPLYNENGVRIGFREDSNGTPVVSALNENILREIAEAGKGAFTRVVTNASGLADILTKLQSLEKTELSKKEFSDYQHRFGWFLAVAIILLSLDMLLAERRAKWSGRINFLE